MRISFKFATMLIKIEYNSFSSCVPEGFMSIKLTYIFHLHSEIKVIWTLIEPVSKECLYTNPKIQSEYELLRCILKYLETGRGNEVRKVLYSFNTRKECLYHHKFPHVLHMSPSDTQKLNNILNGLQNQLIREREFEMSSKNHVTTNFHQSLQELV